MKIFPCDTNAIIIDTQAGHIHIYDKSASESGNVEIIYYDQFRLQIIGKTKEKPLIILDSDEFQAHLRIEESESKWIRLD